MDKGKSNWLVRKVVVFCIKCVQPHQNMPPHKKDCLQNKLMWKKNHISIFLRVLLSEYFIINVIVSLFAAET